MGNHDSYSDFIFDGPRRRHDHPVVTCLVSSVRRLGHRARLREANPSQRLVRERVRQRQRDQPNQQVENLDDPVRRTQQELILRHASVRRQAGKRPQQQHDHYANQHVNWYQSQGVAGPEQQTQDNHHRSKNPDQR
jgi:hypothetical protein